MKSSIADLLSIPLHAPTAHHFDENVKGPVIVSIDPVQPESRTQLLVKAYHVLTTHLQPSIHMALLGDETDGSFAESVEHQINELNLNLAWKTQPSSIDELVTYFKRSHVYCTVSEYPNFEGIEIAATFGLPIVAVDADGLKSFSGDSAVVLPRDAGPLLIAEAMLEVVNS